MPRMQVRTPATPANLSMRGVGITRILGGTLKVSNGKRTVYSSLREESGTAFESRLMHQFMRE